MSQHHNEKGVTPGRWPVNQPVLYEPYEIVVNADPDINWCKFHLRGILRLRLYDCNKLVNARIAIFPDESVNPD